MENTKKCNCGNGYKLTCSNCSKVKMVILLKNKFKYLKISGAKGEKKVNPVWYSHLSKNNKSENTLINAMYRRFQKSEYADKANVVDFYSNTTGDLIKRIRL